MGSTEITDKINKLAEIDAEVLAKLPSIDFHKDVDGFGRIIDMCSKADSLLDEILDVVSCQPSIVISDPYASSILLKMRHKIPFTSVNIYRLLLDRADGIDSDVNKYGDQALDDLTNCYDFFGYYLRKRNIGALICPISPVAEISRYYYEVRELYALGLRSACIALCRALIEMSLKCIIKPGSNLCKTIEIARKEGVVSEEIARVAHKVRIEANDVLHLNRKKENDKIRLEEIILNTVAVVEYIFRERASNNQ